MQQDLPTLLSAQKAAFQSGLTLPLSTRAKYLNQLYAAIKRHESDIEAALRADLGKCATEAYLCEIGMLLSELRYQITHLTGNASPRLTPTPIILMPATSSVHPTPWGNTLIMSPWNYPFLLTFQPLAAAIAAGNTAIVKPSAYSPASSSLIAQIISETFPPEIVAAVTGGREENKALLGQKFDFIFFTGSKKVGKEVLRAASEHLTPTVLELGGKSPCIVDSSAKITLTARRIVMGKFLNCGQTCVAPDYILCDRRIKPLLIGAIVSELKKQLGSDPISNPSLGKIVSRAHYDRLMNLIDEHKIVIGGHGDPDSCRIAPTVLSGVGFDDPIMQEEIFGPILPILTYDTWEDVIPMLRRNPDPLALYLFTENRAHMKEIVSSVSFGGGCINDTVMHLVNPALPFGGVGGSGMGAYHGKTGFEAFSRKKSILKSSTRIDLPLRYRPWGEHIEALLKILLG